MVNYENDIGKFAVIFDSDGVVVDSEPFSLRAFREAMAEQGALLTDEDVMANCGLTDGDIVSYVSRKYGRRLDCERFQRRKQQLYEAKVRAGELKPCAGITALLDALSTDGVPYALASSGSLDKIRFNLSQVGLLKYFSVIVSGEEIKRGKPYPDIFLTASRQLGVPPDTCVVIEDSVNGIEAAHRAQMRCVAVAGTFPQAALAGADFVVESLEQITVKTLQIMALDKNFYKGGGKC